jgi:hypothetical protein|tara:strand:- start:303 stop:539 length:237 start_codon:yes stop_codon:yes gene_type:complete
MRMCYNSVSGDEESPSNLNEAHMTKSEKYTAWQKAEEKEARAQRRFEKFGRNCKVAKNEFMQARNETIKAYRAYKQHQ